MNNYDKLEQDLTADLVAPVGRADASVFFVGLKKIAAGPQPDADLSEHAADVAMGNEATPQEGAAATQQGAPDETGHLEGEFAVDLSQVVMTLAQIVSNSMRQHTAYTYYGETMRDVGRGELAELFTDQAKGELKEMKYFLRRMSVLSPGGVPIPVAPTPEPSADVTVALKFLIAGEQQAIVLFKTLHAMLGENPMKFTIESIMTDAQEHLDKLWQYMPATEAPAEQPKAASKIAAATRILRQKLAAPNQPSPQKGDVPVGPPGSEPLGTVLGREAMLQSAQLMNENADLRRRMDQAGQQQVQAQQTIESLGAENEGLQMQAQQSADMAHQATEQAQMSAEQAAAQADAKMRLSIRIQQLRQDLANIVSADPVQEEGVGFGEGQGAGPGTVATSSQQNQMAQEQAAAEQMAAEQDAAGAKGGSKAKKETAQAQRAQGEAQQQTQQAAAATAA